MAPFGAFATTRRFIEVPRLCRLEHAQRRPALVVFAAAKLAAVCVKRDVCESLTSPLDHGLSADGSLASQDNCAAGLHDDPDETSAFSQKIKRVSASAPVVRKHRYLRPNDTELVDKLEAVEFGFGHDGRPVTDGSRT